MSKAALELLNRIAQHVAADQIARRKEILELHKKLAGKEIAAQSLSEWLQLKKLPGMASTLVLQRYALENGIIAPGEKGVGLFVYLGPVAAPKPLA